MQRVLVLLLSALDALVAAAVGVAAAFAPLMVLWFVAFGATDWSGLWPTSAAVWQLGHAVPLQLTLPDLYLAEAGIDPSAASFTLSLAPLGFGLFTVLFAAGSGVRAARAGAWPWGVAGGVVVFTALAAAVAVTGGSDLAAVHLWQAVLFPAAFYTAGLVCGALVSAYRDGDDGPVDALVVRMDRTPGAWPDLPGLIGRGTAVALVGVIGAGALVTAISVAVGGGRIVALSQAANLDLMGVVVLGLAQLLYLPVLVVWAVSFIAGPGFALGAGTAVSPAGTELGVVPGIPLLGALPDDTSPWLYVLVLLPVAAGAFAGWIVRSRLRPESETFAVQAVIALGIAVLTAAVTALLCVLASGSLGPGRLAEVGPSAGAVALAIGIEVGVGAGILLLSPRAADRRPDRDGAPLPDEPPQAWDAAAPTRLD
ncbi:cell division protein PerM [Microbacterium sp. GXF7504]